MSKKIFVKSISALLLTLAVLFVGQIKVQAATTDPNELLGATNWEGTFVYDENGNNVTDKNLNFIGRAKYDASTNRYEFFDKITNQSRGDKGVFFVTPDGKQRVLLSQLGYNVAVDMVQLDQSKFTYRRNGVQKDNSTGYVFVEHVPYSGELNFTFSPPDLTKITGEIIKDQPGKQILATTFWRGTVAKDASGNDVSAYNAGFLGLARYDLSSGRYEFFNAADGTTRGDFGYFSVINGNKERTSFSLGLNYSATLELTELNNQRFTYARIGKDSDGNNIPITVEHEPYTGAFPLAFTFNPSTETIVQPPINTDTDTPKSNAIVEVTRPIASGTVKFSDKVASQASIVFNQLNVEKNPITVAEKELGKATLSVVDTRKGATNDAWTVKAKLDNGQFGEKGFVANQLGILLNPTTTENTIAAKNNITLDGSSEQDIFTINYQSESPETKSVMLNPVLVVNQINLLQAGIYGANMTWTLTPTV